jgi:hypothetical protein
MDTAAAALEEFAAAGPAATFVHGAGADPAAARVSAALRRAAGRAGLAVAFVGDLATRASAVFDLPCIGSLALGAAVMAASAVGLSEGLHVAQSLGVPFLSAATLKMAAGGAGTGFVAGSLSAFSGGQAVSKLGGALAALDSRESVLDEGEGWRSVRRDTPTASIVYRADLAPDGRETARRVHCDDGWAVVKKGLVGERKAAVGGEQAYVVRVGDESTSPLLPKGEAKALAARVGGKVRLPEEADMEAIRRARADGLGGDIYPLAAAPAPRA